MPSLLLFVRGNLSPPHRLVQAAHGACAAGAKFPGAAQCKFIVLRLDKDFVQTTRKLLEQSQLAYGEFFEPHRNWGVTCIYTEPVETTPDWLDYFDLL